MKGGYLEEIGDGGVSEEAEQSLHYDFFKDEVLVVIAHILDIIPQHVVEPCLPLLPVLRQRLEILIVLRRHLYPQDRLIDAVTQSRGDAALGVLDNEGRVVLVKHAIADQNPFIYKGLLLVDSDLTKSDMQLCECLSQLFDRLCLDLEGNRAPRQHHVPCKVPVLNLQNPVQKRLRVIEISSRVLSDTEDASGSGLVVASASVNVEGGRGDGFVVTGALSVALLALFLLAGLSPGFDVDAFHGVSDDVVEPGFEVL